MEESLRRPLSRDRMNQSLSENWFRRRQKSAIADSWHGGGPKGDGLSSVQQAGGSKSLQTDNTPKGYTPEHTRKSSQHRPEAFSHDRRINRRSTDTTKRGYRGTRPSTSSDERSKSGVMNSSMFEVKLSDFPELCDITSSSPKTAFLQGPRMCWGPVTSPAHQDSIVDQNICQNMVGFQDTLGKKGPKQKSTEQVTSAGKCEKTLTPGQDTGLRLPNPYESPAASWANIASQPPKVIQKSSATDTAQVEKSQQQAEQTTEKKKRKKKKKSKTASEGMEPTDDVPHVIQQEPPRFEDEEEFPDLSCTFVNLHKGLRHTSSTATQDNAGLSEKEALSLHPESVNKSKTTAGKPFTTDSKKTQQVSQKKSKAPVQLDLGNMLTVLEQKQQSQKSKQDVKPLTLSVGGALPVVHKEPTVPKKHPWQQERIAHNPLDSTSPLVKKGKQREVPKAKKPTPLKRVILKEREERKQNRLLEERDPARLDSEASQTETHSSETQEETSNPISEIITNDLDLESEHSGHTDAEETDQTSLQVISMDNTAEEKTLSKTWNPDPNPNPNRPKIHSRKFREYCSQMLSKDVDECVTNLLKELVRFQDRLYQKDPMKARMKRRLVMGLREVLKHLKLRKVKCVIISPNCERVQSKGGLDEALHAIIDTCREQGVPFVFALSRKSLGRCVNKAVPVSLVGIFNFDGAQDHYHKMIELTSQARKAYEVMIANLEVTSEEQQGEEEMPQNMETPSEPPATEEPEYIKIWKKMLEKDYNHKFLALEEQFSSAAISTDSDALPDDHDGS